MSVKMWIPILAAVIALALVAAVAMVIVLEDEDDEGPETDGEDEGTQEEGDEEDDRRNGAQEEDTPENTEPEAPESGFQENASIEVTDAWIDEGDCVLEQSLDERYCHRLRVLVHASEAEEFNVAIPFWEAQDGEGEGHRASWVVSPDPVEAGTSRSITVSFHVDPDVRLTELSYVELEGRESTAPVPMYDLMEPT